MQGFLNNQTKEEMVMVLSLELVGMMEEKQVVERKITVFIIMRSFKQMLVGAILKEVRSAMVSVMVEVRGTTPVMPLLWGIKRT
jgi:sensor c-di-GMP phosphodiesterase-like protein